MIIGKVLREKYGFDKPETVSVFRDKYGYGERILEKILRDEYPVLLTCHLNDISEFTGVPIDVLCSMQDTLEAMGFKEYLEKVPPMGKPYVCIPPVIGIVDINPGVITRSVNAGDLSHATGLSIEELKEHMSSDGKTVDIEFTDLSSIMQMPIKTIKP